MNLDKKKYVLNKNVLNKLENIFSEFKDIKAVYLFGSYALGAEDKDSDLDLGILLDGDYDKIIKLDILTKLSGNGFDNVDLVILNDASILLSYEIVKHNSKIYVSSDFEPAAYFSLVIRKYLDFKPYLEVQRKYFKERILNG